MDKSFTMKRNRYFHVVLTCWLMITLYLFLMASVKNPSQTFIKIMRTHQRFRLKRGPPPNLLPDAPKVKSICQNPVDILFFIHTAPSERAYRVAYRQSLGDKDLAKHYNWAHVFFLGLSSEADLNNSIIEEATEFMDIVVLPHLDTHRNLTHKFMGGIKWVSKNCPVVRFVFKIDFATFFNIFKIMEYLEKNSTSKDKEFYCCPRLGSQVVRNENSKWYLSEEEYPSDTYPMFCSGQAIIFPGVILDMIIQASTIVRYHPNDNTYVTGDLAVVARIGHRDLCSVFEGRNLTEIVDGKVYAGVFRNEDFIFHRMRAWNIMVKKYHKEQSVN